MKSRNDSNSSWLNIADFLPGAESCICPRFSPTGPAPLSATLKGWSRTPAETAVPLPGLATSRSSGSPEATHAFLLSLTERLPCQAWF